VSANPLLDTLKPTVEPPPGRANGWIYLNDLPTPPEVAEAVESSSKRRGNNAKQKQDLLERSKLEYYFAGQVVAYLRTPQGRAVVASSKMTQEEYDAAKARLSPTERANLTVDIPLPWNQALIPFYFPVEEVRREANDSEPSGAGH
jgi:hypothetical protein